MPFRFVRLLVNLLLHLLHLGHEIHWRKLLKLIYIHRVGLRHLLVLHHLLLLLQQWLHRCLLHVRQVILGNLGRSLTLSSHLRYVLSDWSRLNWLLHLLNRLGRRLLELSLRLFYGVMILRWSWCLYIWFGLCNLSLWRGNRSFSFLIALSGWLRCFLKLTSKVWTSSCKNLIVNKMLTFEKSFQFLFEELPFFKQLLDAFCSNFPTFQDPWVLFPQLSVALLQFIIFLIDLSVFVVLFFSVISFHLLIFFQSWVH